MTKSLPMSMEHAAETQLRQWVDSLNLPPMEIDTTVTLSESYCSQDDGEGDVLEHDRHHHGDDYDSILTSDDSSFYSSDDDDDDSDEDDDLTSDDDLCEYDLRSLGQCSYHTNNTNESILKKRNRDGPSPPASTKPVHKVSFGEKVETREIQNLVDMEESNEIAKAWYSKRECQCMQAYSDLLAQYLSDGNFPEEIEDLESVRGLENITRYGKKQYRTITRESWSAVQREQIRQRQDGKTALDADQMAKVYVEYTRRASEEATERAWFDELEVMEMEEKDRQRRRRRRTTSLTPSTTSTSASLVDTLPSQFGLEPEIQQEENEEDPMKKKQLGRRQSTGASKSNGSGHRRNRLGGLLRWRKRSSTR